MPLSHLKTLLLQARQPDDPARSHELACFARGCGLAPEQIDPWDLLEGPPPLETIRKYDALMIGGSGDFSVATGNLPHLEALLVRLEEVVAVGHPTFASCFGFQLLVAALGGEVIHDPDRLEVGTFTVSLTEEGASDPIFGGLPKSFQAQMGHKDRAARLPEGLTNLAFTERCPFQALRIPNKPIWAAQFHPELDHLSNKFRYDTYKAAYVGPQEKNGDAVPDFECSPEASSLMNRFFHHVFATRQPLATTQPVPHHVVTG